MFLRLFFVTALLFGYHAPCGGGSLAQAAAPIKDEGEDGVEDLRVGNVYCSSEGEAGSPNLETTPLEVNPPGPGGGLACGNQPYNGPTESGVEVLNVPGHEQGHGSALSLVRISLAASGRETVHRTSGERQLELARRQNETKIPTVAGETEAPAAWWKGQGQAEAGYIKRFTDVDSFAAAMEEHRRQGGWQRPSRRSSATGASWCDQVVFLDPADAYGSCRGYCEGGGGQWPAVDENSAHTDYKPGCSEETAAGSTSWQESPGDGMGRVPELDGSIPGARPQAVLGPDDQVRCQGGGGAGESECSQEGDQGPSCQREGSERGAGGERRLRCGVPGAHGREQFGSPGGYADRPGPETIEVDHGCTPDSHAGGGGNNPAETPETRASRRRSTGWRRRKQYGCAPCLGHRSFAEGPNILPQADEMLENGWPCSLSRWHSVMEEHDFLSPPEATTNANLWQQCVEMLEYDATAAEALASSRGSYTFSRRWYGDNTCEQEADGSSCPSACAVLPPCAGFEPAAASSMDSTSMCVIGRNCNLVGPHTWKGGTCTMQSEAEVQFVLFPAVHSFAEISDRARKRSVTFSDPVQEVLPFRAGAKLQPYTSPGAEAKPPKGILKPVRRPSMLSYVLAGQIELLPDTLTGPLPDKPIGELGAICAGPAHQGRHMYTVCEPRQHMYHRHADADWTPQDYLADAAASVHYVVRSAQFLLRPLRDEPAPQIVMTPVWAERTQTSIPVDLRTHNGQVCTVIASVGDTPTRIAGLVAAQGCSFDLGLQEGLLSGKCAMQLGDRLSL